MCGYFEEREYTEMPGWCKRRVFGGKKPGNEGFFEPLEQEKPGRRVESLTGEQARVCLGRKLSIIRTGV